MRRAFLTLAVFALSAPFVFAAEIPKTPLRKSPEYQVDMTNGKPLLLSSLKGKVVCVEFLFTTCPHCQHASQMFTKLYRELGPRGFQPVGIAINEMAGMLVNDFIRDFQVAYPVGFSQMPTALHYLQIDPTKRWVVPQVVLIDRKGMIRYQTPFNGDDKIQDEAYMRKQIMDLLNETGAVSAKPIQHPTKAAAKNSGTK